MAAASRDSSQHATDASTTAGVAQAPGGAFRMEHVEDHSRDPLGLARFLEKRERDTKTSGENIGLATTGSSRGASQSATNGGWTKYCTTSPSLCPFSSHVHFAPPPPPLPPACNIAAEYDIVYSGDRHQYFLTRLALNAFSLVQYYMFRGGGGE